jgi:hypothetical protein
MTEKTFVIGSFLAVTLGLGYSPHASSDIGFTQDETQQIQALNQNLVRFDSDYQDQLRAFSEREQGCLALFVSASCLDELRRDAAQARRQHELAKELLRRDIRQIEANVRMRQRLEADAKRTQRLEEGSKTPKNPSSSGQVRLD